MKEKFYFPELDGLRFLAFFVVFIHHGPAFPWIPGYENFRPFGWIGVDLFLCLSAFLFVHLLRMEWEKTGTINVWFFYLRRTLRIWPIYIIFGAVIFITIIARNAVNNLSLLRVYGLFTFTDNILSAYLGYSVLPWASHLWTISYEEQFYAFIPWFLRYMFRRSKQKQIITLLGILALGSAIRTLFIFLKIGHPAIWVLPITHFESILFGLAVGLGVFDTLFKRIPSLLLAVAGVAGIYFSTMLPNVWTIDWSLMGLYPLVGLSVALLVYATLKAQHHPATAWLRWKPVAFLGKISYGLYLFHLATIDLVEKWVILNFPGKLPLMQSMLIFGIALAATILIASLSYILIEKPFLKVKSRFTIVQSRPI